MKIATWNVNGIRAAFEKGFSDFVREQQPEVLMLQEVKALPEQVNELLKTFSEEYNIYFSPAIKKGYSGVSTWIKKPLITGEVRCGLGELRFDTEGRYLVVPLGNLLLYNVYFPSGTSGELRQSFKYEFLDHFLAHIQSLSKVMRKRLIVAGDFNICHRDIDIHHPEEATKRKLTGFLPQERAWLDSFVAAGFIDSLRHIQGDKAKLYTWWSQRANSRAKDLGWRIDYIFIDQALKKRLSDAALFPKIRGSDHCPMLVTID